MLAFLYWQVVPVSDGRFRGAGSTCASCKPIPFPVSQLFGLEVMLAHHRGHRSGAGSARRGDRDFAESGGPLLERTGPAPISSHSIWCWASDRATPSPGFWLGGACARRHSFF